MSGIKCSIRDWAVWMPVSDDSTSSNHQVSAPSLGLIPAMMRRRLGQQGKMAVSVCSALIEDQPQLPMVFCSRHGEIQRSLEILTTLIDGETPSPMAFSLSVHNAVSGMLSIATHNTQAITAMAAGEHAIVNALTEACMILHAGKHDAVLCVIHDLPLPELYDDAGIDPAEPYAIALLLEQSGDCPISIDFSHKQATQPGMLEQVALLTELLDGNTEQLALAAARITRLSVTA